MISTPLLQQQFAQGLDDFLKGCSDSALNDPIKYLLSLKSKRIRPLLAMSVCTAEGGSVEDGMPSALAVELFHNFTLMHDDIMDKAPIRRGEATAHVKFGENAAILSGDVMFVLAYEALEKASDLPQLLRMLNTTAKEVCEGQQRDMEFESRDDVTASEYLEMIRLKTSVLLAASCAMGAISAGAPKERVELWYEFGEKLGLAFQIQDDYLDTFGEEKNTGKRVGGDILCDKKTFLRIQTQAKQDLPDTSKCSEKEKIELIKGLMVETGADVDAKNLMNSYSADAAKSLQKLKLEDDSRQWFEALLISVVERLS